MTITLYLHNNRPTFTPHPEADRVTLEAPDGSAVLSVFGLTDLYVPTDHLVRVAWPAKAVHAAATRGHHGFAVISRQSPGQERLAARWADQRSERERAIEAKRHERSERVRQQVETLGRLRAEGKTVRERAAAVGRSASWVRLAERGQMAV